LFSTCYQKPSALKYLIILTLLKLSMYLCKCDWKVSFNFQKQNLCLFELWVKCVSWIKAYATWLWNLLLSSNPYSNSHLNSRLIIKHILYSAQHAYVCRDSSQTYTNTKLVVTPLLESLWPRSSRGDAIKEWIQNKTQLRTFIPLTQYGNDYNHFFHSWKSKHHSLHLIRLFQKIYVMP